MDVSIRPAEVEDADAIFELRSDPRLSGMQYRPAWWESPEHYVQSSIVYSKLELPPFRCWTVLVDGIFTGHVSEMTSRSSDGLIETAMGWNVVPEHWGKGIAPRAIKQVLTRGFDKHEMIEFTALYFESNSRCKRVLDKLGFLFEPPSFREKFNNWIATYGQHKLEKSRLTRREWNPERHASS